jgi:SAM-dependent methyltransferase
VDIYSEDFSWVYNEEWPDLSARLWPFIAQVVHERLREARDWLDLCCGTGRLLEILVREGYSATGLDLSPHQLAHARRNVPEAELVKADIRDFRLGRQFDVITCLFDSINYLTTKRDLERAFRNVRRHLAGPGMFVFDVCTLAGYRDATYVPGVRRTDATVTVIEGWFEPRRRCRHTRITGFIKRGKLYKGFDEEHVQRGYDSEEIDALLERAGFAFETYDARTMEETAAGTDRVLYVCRQT